MMVVLLATAYFLVGLVIFLNSGLSLSDIGRALIWPAVAGCLIVFAIFEAFDLWREPVD